MYYVDVLNQILTIVVDRNDLSHLTGATHHVLDAIGSDKELYTSLRSVVVKSDRPGRMSYKPASEVIFAAFYQMVTIYFIGASFSISIIEEN